MEKVVSSTSSGEEELSRLRGPVVGGVVPTHGVVPGGVGGECGLY
jgi:hypothetical protein